MISIVVVVVVVWLWNLYSLFIIIYNLLYFHLKLIFLQNQFVCKSLNYYGKYYLFAFTCPYSHDK